MGDEYVFSQKDLDKMLDDALAIVEKGSGGQAPPGGGPSQSLRDRLLKISRGEESPPTVKESLPE